MQDPENWQREYLSTRRRFESIWDGIITIAGWFVLPDGRKIPCRHEDGTWKIEPFPLYEALMCAQSEIETGILGYVYRIT